MIGHVLLSADIQMLNSCRFVVGTDVRSVCKPQVHTEQTSTDRKFIHQANQKPTAVIIITNICFTQRDDSDLFILHLL